MHINRTVVALSLFACLLAPGVPAAAQPASGFMDIDEVRPGMRGYGLTVFQDARIDTFHIEVLGVMKNIFYAKHDIIMVGVSGPYVDDAGVIAGMSGSPVYIDGKLVGALAYRFGAFPMKPIGGVTPIGHMLAIRDAVETEPAPDRNAPGGDGDGTGGPGGDYGPGPALADRKTSRVITGRVGLADRVGRAARAARAFQVARAPVPHPPGRSKTARKRSSPDIRAPLRVRPASSPLPCPWCFPVSIP